MARSTHARHCAMRINAHREACARKLRRCGPAADFGVACVLLRSRLLRGRSHAHSPSQPRSGSGRRCGVRSSCPRRLGRRARRRGRAHQDLHQSGRADRAEPRARARGLRHRDRRGRADPHHRLSDGRGACRRGDDQRRPHRCGGRRRLRSRDRLRHSAHAAAAEDQAARLRPLGRRERERSGAGRKRRRAEHGRSRAGRGETRIRRQLGIPARRGDLHRRRRIRPGAAPR